MSKSPPQHDRNRRDAKTLGVARISPTDREILRALSSASRTPPRAPSAPARVPRAAWPTCASTTRAARRSPAWRRS